jgi:VWFA-related protein
MTRNHLFVPCVVCLTSTIAAVQIPTFTSRIESVRVDVLVSDSRGPILGLQATDFEIEDAGVLQQVDLVAFEQVPLSVVLALDTSASVEGNALDRLRSAGRMAVDALKDGDRAALVTFATAVSVRAPLTADASRLRLALAQPIETGNTALVDATYTALALAESDTERPLAIVFSDGADTASFLAPDAVLATARRSDTVVYVVRTNQRSPARFLDDVAALTGGRVLPIDSSRTLGSALLAVFDEFRQRYVISYKPHGVSPNGWHTLRVRVKNRRVTIRARPGYQAGS